MSKIIIKLEQSNALQTSKEGVKINKITSSISPLSLIKLLKEADNKINPRTATENKVTRAIYETLDKSPELFWYKTKGILIATKECRFLERNRVELSFDEPEFEGIMDGGHNTFAIARFLIDKLFGETFKDWNKCKAYWADNYDTILKKFNAEENNPAYRFSIPVEIICPNNEEGSVEEYYNVISEICSARNSNVELKATALGNQVGCYEYLKEILQNYPIIWKTGEKGTIKSEDVIAMADIPLLFLQQIGKLPKDVKSFNRVNAYSSKGQCVTFFNSVLSHEAVASTEKGRFQITSELVKSALDMTEDIMKYFDCLYQKFPALYNAHQGSFGRITSVKLDKEVNPLFGTQPKSAPYYPDGFIYPLVVGLTSLMTYDEPSNTIKWKVNPASIDFDFNKIPLTKYIDMIKLIGYDPQKVGKTQLFYIEAADAYRVCADETSSLF